MRMCYCASAESLDFLRWRLTEENVASFLPDSHSELPVRFKRLTGVSHIHIVVIRLGNGFSGDRGSFPMKASNQRLVSLA